MKHQFLLSNKWFLIWMVVVGISAAVNAQNFVRVTDTSNPIVTVSLDDYWTGAAWVDYDGDNDLDLFLINRIPGISPRRNKLFRNDDPSTGSEWNFTEITDGILVNDFGFWFGTSWADYDNDGDLDCHVAGFPSRLYSNNGDGSFNRINSGAIAAGNLGGIGTAWSDYDNDGNLDLVIVWPSWLQGPPSVGPPRPPHLFKSDGAPNYTFTKINTGPIVAHGNDTYLHPSWYDYDDDGDQDLFIGRGAGTPQTDLMYRNLLSESGTANFETLAGAAFAAEPLEGQHWNFIDIDNDGDLDVFATSWANTGPPFDPEPNRLFRNDDDNFVKIESGLIVTDEDPSVTNVWGDYDNDGDIDCIVTTDSTYALNLYSNNGDGTFEKITTGDLPNTVLHQSCATVGDYDNDGDLDIFVAGDHDNSALFRNDLANGNNWVKLRLIGTSANRSGIGATVRAKAIINGQPVWQRRDLSAANSFFGHNSLNIHLGFGDAAVIDTLKLEWPSGSVDIHTNVPLNLFYSAEEGQGLGPLTGIKEGDSGSILPQDFQLNQNFPNPFNPSTIIEFALPEPAHVRMEVYDLAGHSILTLLNEYQSAGIHRVQFDAGGLASGIYFYRLRAGQFQSIKKMVYMR